MARRAGGLVRPLEGLAGAARPADAHNALRNAPERAARIRTAALPGRSWAGWHHGAHAAELSLSRAQTAGSREGGGIQGQELARVQPRAERDGRREAGVRVSDLDRSRAASYGGAHER